MRRGVLLRDRGTVAGLEARARHPRPLDDALELVRATIEERGDITPERVYELMFNARDPGRLSREAARLRLALWRRRGRKAPPWRVREPLE